MQPGNSLRELRDPAPKTATVHGPQLLIVAPLMGIVDVELIVATTVLVWYAVGLEKCATMEVVTTNNMISASQCNYNFHD